MKKSIIQKMTAIFIAVVLVITSIAYYASAQQLDENPLSGIKDIIIPGMLQVGFTEKYTGLQPQEWLPELSIQDIKDFYEDKYITLSESSNVDENIFSQMKELFGKVYTIKLADETAEGVIAAINSLNNNAYVAMVAPVYKEISTNKPDVKPYKEITGIFEYNAETLQSDDFEPGIVYFGLKNQYKGMPLDDALNGIDFTYVEDIDERFYESMIRLIYENEDIANSISYVELDKAQNRIGKEFKVYLADESRNGTLQAIETMSKSMYIAYAQPQYKMEYC